MISGALQAHINIPNVTLGCRGWLLLVLSTVLEPPREEVQEGQVAHPDLLTAQKHLEKPQLPSWVTTKKGGEKSSLILTPQTFKAKVASKAITVQAYACLL